MLSFYDGLMVQLHSTGTGLWAVRWLCVHPPEPQDLQEVTLQRQEQGDVPWLHARVDNMILATAIAQAKT